MYVDSIFNLIFCDLEKRIFLCEMKRKLPSFEEIFCVQKEPCKQDNWIDAIRPIPTEEILQSVKNQTVSAEEMPQQLINQPQDVPVIQQQIKQGHNPIVLPKINEEVLSLQQNYEFSFSDPSHIQFYNDLCMQEDYSLVPFDDKQIEYESNEYVTYLGGIPWNDKGRNYSGTKVIFMPTRGLCTTRQFAHQFASIHAEHTLLDTAKIKIEQLQVYEIQGKTKAMDLLTYYKKLFIMFSIINQIDLFTNNVGRERLNTSHVDICWKEHLLNHFFSSWTGPNLGLSYNQRSIDIRYLNIRKMIMIGYFNGQMRYFQVKFINTKTYVIGNIFPDDYSDQPQYLPSYNQADFYKQPVPTMDMFSTDIQNYMYEPFKKPEETFFKTAYLTQDYKCSKKSIRVQEIKVVDFAFEFFFPTAFIHHVTGANEQFYPILFHEDSLLYEQMNTGTPKDTLIFTVESWQLLKNFLLTVLFPEQYSLPPAQVPDQSINEELIEQVVMPTEEQRPKTPVLEQPSQGFLPQGMEIEDSSKE